MCTERTNAVYYCHACERETGTYLTSSLTLVCDQCFSHFIEILNEGSSGSTASPEETYRSIAAQLAPQTCCSGDLQQLRSEQQGPKGCDADEKRHEADEDECPICQVEMSSKEHITQRLSCGHCFHRECIGTWLARSDTCPNCRQMVSIADICLATIPPDSL